MTNKNEFINSIRNQLKKLSSKQQAKFAWLCAIRALPFLSMEKIFNYRERENKQRMLFSIFWNIDISAAILYAVRSDKIAYAPHAVYVAIAAGNIVCISASAKNTAENTAYAAAVVAKTAALAVRAAIDAADIVVDGSKDVIFAAADAAKAAIDAADATGNTFRIDQFYELLCSDIDKIHKNKINDFDSGIIIYGEIWHKFLDDLNATGCGYWANLYADLFNNKFKIDKKKLRRRMDVPEEIREKGASAVGEWLENIESQGTQYLNEARIIILGEKGAGKTSLAVKLHDINAELPKKEESTKGVDVSVWNLPENPSGNPVIAHIWDFAGHAVTHSAHKFFLSERCLYIIVYDGRSERRNFLEYWLNHVIYYGGKSPVFILVNKQDEHTVDIDENGLMDKYPDQIQGFYYLSLKDDRQKLEGFREAVEKFIKNNPAWNKEMPKFWFDVKEKLSKKFSDEKIDFISTEHFKAIAKDSNVVEDKKFTEMRSALHSLGICLYYEQIKELETYILNPNWITNGIYTIINWLRIRQDYKINLSDLKKVFEEDAFKYPQDKHKFLFNLLSLYKLAYPYETEEDSETFVLPALLSEGQPERNMENDFPVSQSLYMRYKADTDLPPDIISHFIVRHHREIISKNGVQVVWRKGVKLQDKFGNTALVIEDSHTREIKVCVKGIKRDEYLTRLRETLNRIFMDYKSNYPALEYAVEVMGQIVYISDKKILIYARKNQRYLDENTGESINMTVIKNQYNITDSAVIKGDENTTVIKPENANINSAKNSNNVTAINFYDCVIRLPVFQGELANLANDLKKAGYNNDAEYINEIAEAADEMLNSVKNEPVNENIEETLTKKGILSKIKNFYEDITDENSELYKNTVKLRNGAKKAQSILKVYNDIAKIIPVLPQVPDVLLNIGK